MTSRVQSEESETGHCPAQAVIGYLEQNALTKVDLYVKWHTIGIHADQISKKAVFVKWANVQAMFGSFFMFFMFFSCFFTFWLNWCLLSDFKNSSV